MEILWRSFPYLLQGAGVTVALFMGSLVVGTLIGLAAGLVSVSRRRLARAVVATYVYVIRGIPLLVHLFIIYYFLPAVGLDVDPYVGAVIALGLYNGVYLSEITRGAIGSVSRGQLDAAQSLGMTRGQGLRRIVLPQAIRYFIPPYVNNAVMLVKLTSIVSVINIWELTLAAREVVERTLAPFQMFAGVALIYFAICYSFALLGRRMERRIAFSH